MILPPWPSTPPRHGPVVLREVAPKDIPMAHELSTDPYVPQAGSLPFDASSEDGLAWVTRQQGRHSEGAGFSFAIALAVSDEAVGHCGLWLKSLADGLGTAGYAINPRHRRLGYAVNALRALTDFGWTVPGLLRIVLHLETWNIASQRTAQRVGYSSQKFGVGHRIANGETRDMLVYEAVRPGS